MSHPLKREKKYSHYPNRKTYHRPDIRQCFKLGASLAITLPQEAVINLQLFPHADVAITYGDNAIVIRKARITT